MLDGLRHITDSLVGLYGQMLFIFVGLGLLFAIIAIFERQRSSPGDTWWHNPGLKTDITYKVVDKIIGPYVQMPPVFVIYGLLCGITTSEQALAYVSKGIGPLSTLPFWAQCIVYLVLGDFLLYWLHRLMHSQSLWKYHAAHHSAKQVDWTTSYRFHPVNHMICAYLVVTILVTLGMSPAVFAFMLPWEIITGAYVHANLNWSHGRYFKYVLASPVFHRWHHGPADQGGSSNFAPTFPFWDAMFGTFYMPEGQLPQTFGVDDPDYPETYVGQLLYPLLAKPVAREPGAAVSSG